MSATLDSARGACQQLHGVAIQVIDSQSESLGLSMIVIAAARAAPAGKEVNEVVSLMEALIPKVNVIFTVDTLEYLLKGGRIGAATTFLGSMLIIKPILYIKDGRIEPLEKARTKKRAIARVLDLVAELLVSEAGPIIGTHAGPGTLGICFTMPESIWLESCREIELSRVSLPQNANLRDPDELCFQNGE